MVETLTKNLRQSEARYRAAMRLGKMGSWETDFVCGTRSWSPEAVALFDLTQSDGIVGGDRDELIAAMHPDDRHLMAQYHQYLLDHDEVEAEYRIVLRDGTTRQVAGRGLVVSRQESGEPHILINVVTDVTERAKAEEHLSEYAKNLSNSKARFEALVEATAQIVWSATPSGQVAEDSPSWRAFTGQSQQEYVEEGWLDAVHPEDRDRTRQTWREAVRKHVPYQVDYRLLHVSGGYRWTRARGVPMTTANGTIIEWVGMNEDIDDTVKRNEQLAIVTRELSHRTKNLLAVVQSIARRTFANEQDDQPTVATFLDRLQGLAVSHDLLVHGNWSSVLLEDLVREHLKPFVSADDVDIDIVGPPVGIAPSAAQNLGLALHELATNAAKYGALKTPAGKLRIHWSLSNEENGEILTFHWNEVVSLTTTEKQKGGFGSQLLDRIVAASLGGSTHYQIADTGVEWRLVAPSSALSQQH
ncbi:MAG: sensor histidine kinase [Hyphomicrobiaceae bacterium]